MANFQNTYCHFVEGRPDDDLHKIYHDQHYGFPIEDDNELFGRLLLEINQAGLNWTTILKKQENLRKAYDGFSLQKVANYQESDFERLLRDKGIIRNKLKINAAIYNAQQILKLQKEFGSFKQWILNQGELSKQEWVKLFKKHFKFVGGEIVNEFMMSCGFYPGAHHPDCNIYEACEKALQTSSYR